MFHPVIEICAHCKLSMGSAHSGFIMMCWLCATFLSEMSVLRTVIHFDIVLRLPIIELRLNWIFQKWHLNGIMSHCNDKSVVLYMCLF